MNASGRAPASTILSAHSEKEEAAGTYKRTFGFHPLLCYLDQTDEALAGVLRPGNAGSNTTADHFEVLQMALEQLPEADRDREILARADVAGATHAFTADCREADLLLGRLRGRPAGARGDPRAPRIRMGPNPHGSRRLTPKAAPGRAPGWRR
jgi:Transposase DDE domain group 1